MNTDKWDRIRLEDVNENDYRCVKWPPLGPYWCSGYSYKHAIVVAYVPAGTTDETIKEYWPEITKIDRMQTNIPLTFSDRFAKPDWWDGPSDESKQPVDTFTDSEMEELEDGVEKLISDLKKAEQQRDEARAVLQGIIDHCVHPNDAVRAVMVDLAPIRRVLANKP